MARLGVVRLFGKKGEEGRECCTYNLVPPPSFLEEMSVHLNTQYRKGISP